MGVQKKWGYTTPQCPPIVPHPSTLPCSHSNSIGILGHSIAFGNTPRRVEGSLLLTATSRVTPHIKVPRPLLVACES